MDSESQRRLLVIFCRQTETTCCGLSSGSSGYAVAYVTGCRFLAESQPWIAPRASGVYCARKLLRTVSRARAFSAWNRSMGVNCLALRGSAPAPKRCTSSSFWKKRMGSLTRYTRNSSVSTFCDHIEIVAFSPGAKVLLLEREK